MIDTSYKDYVLDLFMDFEGVTSRRMFGGWGLYHKSTFFGLIFEDELYFKVDESNQKMYTIPESRPFKYERGGKRVTLSYWLVPLEESRPWAAEAVPTAGRPLTGRVPEEIMEEREKLYDLADMSIVIKKKKIK